MRGIKQHKERSVKQNGLLDKPYEARKGEYMCMNSSVCITYKFIMLMFSIGLCCMQVLKARNTMIVASYQRHQ